MGENTLAVAERAGRKLVCPKCKCHMRVGFADTLEVDICEKCGSLWLDTGEEQEMLRSTLEEVRAFTLDKLRQIRTAYQGLSQDVGVRYIPCPICGEMMNRNNWGAGSGVILDKCYRHGTWYDEGEIEKIREFILAGGIEFQKLQMVEEGLHALNQKLSNVVRRQDASVLIARPKLTRFFGAIGFY